MDSEDKRTGSGLQSLLGNDDNNLLEKKGGEGHNLLRFGKRSRDNGHNIMRFGKRDDDDSDDKRNYNQLLHFGKKDDKRGHSLMHFGKREDGDGIEDLDDFDKRGHNLLHFGKRDDDLEEEKRQNKFIHFGKRDNKIMRFGKREDEDKRGHNLLHFGKRDPLAEDEEDIENKRAHSLLHFGKKDGSDGPRRSHSLLHFGKREVSTFDLLPKPRPVRSAGNEIDSAEMLDILQKLLIQQKEGSKRGHTIMRFGKRGGESHSIMRFGKRFLDDEDDNDEEAYSRGSSVEDDDLDDLDRIRQLPFLLKRGSHTHMHFGKRDGHRILSFGKRFYNDYDEADDGLLENEDPQLNNALENEILLPEDALEDQLAGDEDKRTSHSMIHFGKRGGNAMLHFGKRGGGNAMLHFGKRREGNAMLHFGKRDYESRDLQDALLADLKRAHNILHFGKREAPSAIPNSSLDVEDNGRMAKNIQTVEHLSPASENKTEGTRQRRSIDDTGDGYGYQEWSLDTHHPSFLLPRAFSTAEINPFQFPLFLSSFNHLQRAAYPFYRSSRAADKKKNVFLHFGRR